MTTSVSNTTRSSWRCTEMWLLYEAGFTVAQIRKRYGLSRQRVHQLLDLGPSLTNRRDRGRRHLPIAEIQARKTAARITLEIATILSDRGIGEIHARLFGATRGKPPISRPHRRNPHSRTMTKREEVIALWRAGNTHKEISELVGCATNQVSVELARARKNGDHSIRYQNSGWQNRRPTNTETEKPANESNRSCP